MSDTTDYMELIGFSAEEYEELLNMTDEEVVKAAKESSEIKAPIVISIIEYYDARGKMSEKQRGVLLNYIS